MIIDTFSLVTLCAALVLVTAWGVWGWRRAVTVPTWKKVAKTLNQAIDVRDETNAKMWDAFNAQCEQTHAARTSANAWRDVALDNEARSLRATPLPEWPAVDAACARAAQKRVELEEQGIVNKLGVTFKPTSNAGVICDVSSGPCACGAWHPNTDGTEWSLG